MFCEFDFENSAKSPTNKPADSKTPKTHQYQAKPKNKAPKTMPHIEKPSKTKIAKI